MSARFYVDARLASGDTLSLPATAARHVQVLRMQPGDTITLFNGFSEHGNADEGEFEATVTRMGRSDVDVAIGHYTTTEREAKRAVYLAVGMPANDRMDWLVEKATELGVASIQPLMAERSVLRLTGERAEKKLAHWRGIHEATSLSQWLKSAAQRAITSQRLLLSPQGGTQPLTQAVNPTDVAPLLFLSGPEGGLSSAEEAAAIATGFNPITLGPRVLRAETAPLACLAFLSLKDH
jgi:16S rRNA (uracil1498-N3)-methyltransferase